ncbi:hypothetical protein GUITHDRAFT_142300 [Guillardia theta CCMP2712]|uniref:CST complex subunit CTC1 n=1 Tax=Guillardia theta (strain CCMP2712) TaxID=905079 RepID=L1IZA1_GUITC|nr:hypothetical protein GUITHDRAFT_142300 [Guillardia theta CCMP2712]EKX41155.1 hypothetical protein GUITHDRAFT_142300 [Guillardia theta CCMP2712]|eukprot:XP_005828135.1 hypothetical protein GUITHDRAFT_142300 [Guillardia theta CCMP2712]
MQRGMCFQYWRNGICSFKEKCTYRHVYHAKASEGGTEEQGAKPAVDEMEVEDSEKSISDGLAGCRTSKTQREESEQNKKEVGGTARAQRVSDASEIKSFSPREAGAAGRNGNIIEASGTSGRGLAGEQDPSVAVGEQVAIQRSSADMMEDEDELFGLMKVGRDDERKVWVKAILEAVLTWTFLSLPEARQVTRSIIEILLLCGPRELKGKELLGLSQLRQNKVECSSPTSSSSRKIKFLFIAEIDCSSCSNETCSLLLRDRSGCFNVLFEESTVITPMLGKLLLGISFNTFGGSEDSVKQSCFIELKGDSLLDARVVGRSTVSSTYADVSLAPPAGLRPPALSPSHATADSVREFQQRQRREGNVQGVVASKSPIFACDSAADAFFFVELAEDERRGGKGRNLQGSEGGDGSRGAGGSRKFSSSLLIIFKGSKHVRWFPLLQTGRRYIISNLRLSRLEKGTPSELRLLRAMQEEEPSREGARSGQSESTRVWEVLSSPPLAAATTISQPKSLQSMGEEEEEEEEEGASRRGGVVEYEGVLTGVREEGILVLDSRCFVFALALPPSSFALLRLGARLRVVHVLPVITNGSKIALACFSFSSLELVSFSLSSSPPPSLPLLNPLSLLSPLYRSLSPCRFCRTLPSLLQLIRKFRSRRRRREEKEAQGSVGGRRMDLVFLLLCGALRQPAFMGELRDAEREVKAQGGRQSQYLAFARSRRVECEGREAREEEATELYPSCKQLKRDQVGGRKNNEKRGGSGPATVSLWGQETGLDETDLVHLSLPSSYPLLPSFQLGDLVALRCFQLSLCGCPRTWTRRDGADRGYDLEFVSFTAEEEEEEEEEEVRGSNQWHGEHRRIEATEKSQRAIVLLRRSTVKSVEGEEELTIFVTRIPGSVYRLKVVYSSRTEEKWQVTIAVSSVLSACKLEEEEEDSPCRAFLDLCRLRWQELYPIRSVADLVAVGEELPVRYASLRVLLVDRSWRLKHTSSAATVLLLRAVDPGAPVAEEEGGRREEGGRGHRGLLGHVDVYLDTSQFFAPPGLLPGAMVLFHHVSIERRSGGQVAAARALPALTRAALVDTYWTTPRVLGVLGTVVVVKRIAIEAACRWCGTAECLVDDGTGRAWMLLEGRELRIIGIASELGRVIYEHGVAAEALSNLLFMGDGELKASATHLLATLVIRSSSSGDLNELEFVCEFIPRKRAAAPQLKETVLGVHHAQRFSISLSPPVQLSVLEIHRRDLTSLAYSLLLALPTSGNRPLPSTGSGLPRRQAEGGPAQAHLKPP